MGRLGAFCEFLDQGRLTATGLAGNEYHSALTAHCQVEVAIQLSQLPFPGDKDRSLRLNLLCHQEGRGLGVELRSLAGCHAGR